MNTPRITHGPELVHIVPRLLGYSPSDSLVLVTATTKQEGVGELGPSLRLDFSVSDMTSTDAAHVFRSTSPLSAVCDADTVFPVVFSDVLADFHMDWDQRDPHSSYSLLDVEALLEGVAIVREVLRVRGFTVFPALWSGRGGSGQLFAPEVSVSEAFAPADRERLALLGPEAADSFAASVLPPQPDPAAVAAVSALRREEFEDAELVDGLLAEVLVLESRSCAREAGELPAVGLTVDPMAVLALERLCAKPGDRDIVHMVMAGNHPDFVPERLRAFRPRQFLSYARGRVRSGDGAGHIVGLSPSPPRHDFLAESVGWLRACSQLISDDSKPDVYALVAWFEWARGRMSFADHFATCALSERPDHRLADMIQTAVDAGMPPRWMQVS